MSIELFLYLASVLPALGTLLGVAGSTVFAGGILLYFLFMNDTNFEEGTHKRTVPFIWIGAIALLVATAIPDKQTIYMIAGARAAKELAGSQIGKKTLELIEKNLDEMLKGNGK